MCSRWIHNQAGAQVTWHKTFIGIKLLLSKPLKAMVSVISSNSCLAKTMPSALHRLFGEGIKAHTVSEKWFHRVVLPLFLPRERGEEPFWKAHLRNDAETSEKPQAREHQRHRWQHFAFTVKHCQQPDVPATVKNHGVSTKWNNTVTAIYQRWFRINPKKYTSNAPFITTWHFQHN